MLVRVCEQRFESADRGQTNTSECIPRHLVRSRPFACIARVAVLYGDRGEWRWLALWRDLAGAVRGFVGAGRQETATSSRLTIESGSSLNPTTR
jgi:hypothetical protein